MMTVKRLIECLSMYPADRPVCIQGDCPPEGLSADIGFYDNEAQGCLVLDGLDGLEA